MDKKNKNSERKTKTRPFTERVCGLTIDFFSKVRFVPGTRRVKGCIRFVRKHVTGRGKRFRIYKV